MISRRELLRDRPASKPSAFLRQRRALPLLSLAWLACVATVALSVALSGPVRADEGKGTLSGHPAAQLSEQERDREAESISRSIMSPFCPGRTVSSCPNAGPWRDDIRKWVGEGVPADEIRNRLEARFPQHNLTGVPPNRLGWLLPAGAAILAIGALVLALRYLLKPPKVSKQEAAARAAAAAAPPPSKASNAEYDARLDEELETLDR
jgi:cytochrome c-type biogenesis protein CcmH/NrfF